MYIIELLFGLFLIAAIFFGIKIWRVWRRVHKAVNEFNQQFGGDKTSGQTQSQTRYSDTDTGDTIIDTRNPEKVKQKIFSENEGEYVDYVEKD